jgi:hypothetical protein
MLLDAINASLSGSKLVWGAAAIVASLGSRFIISELTPGQQSVLKSAAFKRAALFAMLFLPTRDLLLSAALTVVVSVLLEVVFNENSRYCMLPECLMKNRGEHGVVLAGIPPTLPIASRAPLMAPSAMRGGRTGSQHRGSSSRSSGSGGRSVRFNINDSSEDELGGMFGV